MSRAKMQASNIKFTAMVFCLWMYKFRKIDGFKCQTGDPPLWESPTKRCTVIVNWNCTQIERESVLLKKWIKDDKDTIAQWQHETSEFTIMNGFIGRLERYNENGLILNDLTTKDTGYYKLSVIFGNGSLLPEEITSPIYVPSIPSCEADIYMGTNTSHLNGGNDSRQVFPYDGGQMPAFIIGILVVLGISILALSSTVICLCRKRNVLQNNLREMHRRKGEELSSLTEVLGSQV